MIQVHVLTDNAGMELVSDLALAHYLLSQGNPPPPSSHTTSSPKAYASAPSPIPV